MHCCCCCCYCCWFCLVVCLAIAVVVIAIAVDFALVVRFSVAVAFAILVAAVATTLEHDRQRRHGSGATMVLSNAVHNHPATGMRQSPPSPLRRCVDEVQRASTVASAVVAPTPDGEVAVLDLTWRGERKSNRSDLG